MAPRHAEIAGAGIAGLTAAYDLVKAGHTVSVYEAGAQAGGLASGFRDDGWAWPLERFYHHLFTTDRAIRALVDEIAQRIGIPTSTLAKVNASARADYRSYYTPSLIDGVARLYARDLEVFGYDF